MKNRLFLIALLSLFAGAMLAQNVIADKLTVRAGGVVDFKTGASLKIGSIIINEFSNDPTLADSSNAALVTEAAVKAYVDANGGGGGAQSFTHTQASHGFTVGQLIYFSNASTAKLAKSDYGVADSVAQWVVSEVVDANNFKYCNTCEVSLTTGYTPGSYVWTSTTPGGVTNVQPTATNSQYAGVVRTTSTVWVHVGDIAGGGGGGLDTLYYGTTLLENGDTIPIGGGSALANNGLSMSGDTVQLGGTLYKNTEITAAKSRKLYIGNLTAGGFGYDSYEAGDRAALFYDPNSQGVGSRNTSGGFFAVHINYGNSVENVTSLRYGSGEANIFSVGASNYTAATGLAKHTRGGVSRQYEMSARLDTLNGLGFSANSYTEGGWLFYAGAGKSGTSGNYKALNSDSTLSYAIGARRAGNNNSDYRFFDITLRDTTANAITMYDGLLKFRNADPVPTPGDTTLYGMVNVAGTKSPINLPLSLIGGGGGSDGNGIYSGDGTAPADTDVAVTDSINFDNGTLFINAINNRVGIGTASPDRLLHPEIADATTNTVTYPMRISKITSGAATTGFGLGTEYELENASGTNRVAATEEITYSDAVNATEDATYTLKLIQAGSLATALTVTSGGVLTNAGQITGTNFVTAASSGVFTIASRFVISASADGVVRFANSGGSDFNRLQFGGTTSAFPSLKRSTTNLQARLADDSAFTFIEDLYRRAGSGTPEGAVTAPIGAVYHRTDGGAGTSFYVKESGTGNTGWIAK